MDDENGTAATQPSSPDSTGNGDSISLELNQSLPNYLLETVNKGNNVDLMVDVNEDNNESGAGYDSDGDAEELDAIGDEMHLARMFKLMSITDQDSNEDVEVSDRTMVNFDKELPIDMPTENIKIHCIPEDWIDPPHNVSKNEPPFASVDNPGDWSSFSFRPVFKKENISSIY